MSYLNLDFKSPKQSKMTTKSDRSLVFPPIIIKLLIFISLIVVVFLSWPTSNTKEQHEITETSSLKLDKRSNSQTTTLGIPPKDKLETKSSLIPAYEEIATLTKSVIIRNGDSLSTIFNRQGVNATVLHNIMTEAKDSKILKSIRSGEKFDFIFNEKNSLIQLNYHPDITQTYHYSKDSSGKFSSSVSTNPLEAIPVYREGTIDSSLFLAASKNNIPDNIIMNMVGIFGWDIDFALDIRKGDRFKLIYNELYQDGERIRTGQVLAAEFTNRDKTFQAVLYTDPKGVSNYYSPNGKSMRKAFLRNPVKFSRISSRFTKSRKHPIHGFKRPHRGVDYAASRGTPIYSAGDGKIIYRGRKGGYGRTIIVKHGGKYTTLYAHMNSYQRKLRNGSRVKQGQTIGYVGKSGTATGYHLHYEFRVSGSHRNPLTVKLPAAQPINKEYRDDFNKNKDKLLNMLNIMGNS